MLDHITPLLLTFNEAPNIGRTLKQLAWARDIVIVDSFSTDETLEIAAGYEHVRVFKRAFDSHSAQWNYGLRNTDIRTEWVWALDADHVVSNELVEELRSLTLPEEFAGYWTGFRYCVNGKPLRGTLYPPLVTLYRRSCANYEQDGHTQRVKVTGALGTLRGLIDHDDRKPLAHWLLAQSRYMSLEARKLTALPASELTMPDRLRRAIVVAPVLVFLYCALVKGNILDGKAGLYYTFQRTVAELLLSLHLLHDKIFSR